jgi:hypothetical protein
MSKEALNIILDEAAKIMSASLRKELDLEETVATFTVRRIYLAIFNQLRFTHIRNIKDRKTGEKTQTRTAKYEAWKALSPAQKEKVKKKIETRSRAIMKDLIREFKSINQPGVSIKVTGNSEKFTVRAFVTDSKLLETKVGFKGQEYDIGSFATVRQGYTRILNEVWQDIASYVQKQSGVEDTKLSNEKSFADLEHAFGKSVAERQVGKGITKLYNDVKAQVGSDEATRAVFEELNLEIYLKYVSTDDKTIVEAYVGAKSKNRRQARKEMAVLYQAQGAITAAIKNKLATGKNIKSWSGSDDRVEIEKKKIVETFNKSVKIPTKSINTKRNLSSQTTKKKTVKAKTKTKKSKVVFNPRTKSKEIKRKVASGTPSTSLISLAALINQKLPRVVAGNMTLPGLQYRSGRFANSARVTDITRTQQGFPSIGYTYQRNPYQTFEPGGRQGSTERDPRVVIDRSIREIAGELLVGRFYTRRV